MNGNQHPQIKQEKENKQAANPAEEEDEFEEFNDHGTVIGVLKTREQQTQASCPANSRPFQHMRVSICMRADWDEGMEDATDSRIWETSWDSEEVGDRFSAELKQQVGAQK